MAAPLRGIGAKECIVHGIGFRIRALVIKKFLDSLKLHMNSNEMSIERSKFTMTKNQIELRNAVSIRFNISSLISKSRLIIVL